MKMDSGEKTTNKSHQYTNAQSKLPTENVKEEDGKETTYHSQGNVSNANKPSTGNSQMDAGIYELIDGLIDAVIERSNKGRESLSSKEKPETENTKTEDTKNISTKSQGETRYLNKQKDAENDTLNKGQGISENKTPTAKTKTEVKNETTTKSQGNASNSNKTSTPKSQKEAVNETPDIGHGNNSFQIKHETHKTNENNEKDEVNETSKKLPNQIRFAFWPGLIFLILALSLQIYNDSKPGRNFAKTINKLQTVLCNGYYKNNLSMINLAPWSYNLEDEAILEDMFISQSFYTDKEEHSNLLDFFSWQAEAFPKRLLIVGEQGAGKTTSIQFASRVWCKEVLQWKYRAALQLKYSFDHLHDKYGTPAWRSVSQSFQQILSRLSSMIVFFLQNLSEIFLGMSPRDATSYVQSITEVLQFFELKSLPELFLTFEFKDVCNKRFLVDIVKNVVVDIDISEISEVLDKGSETILLAFDGWDEYNSLKQDIGGSQEIDGIIKREERQNFNLIVTTRPWRSDDLLNVKRLQFKKVSMTKFDTPKRNNFIKNFFRFYPPEQMAEDLISVLDNKASVVPKEFETEPRMLLYVCNMWRVDNKIREDKFVSSDLFWDGIWGLMMKTYNMKYPEKKISQELLKGLRRLIGDFVNRNPGEISFETFYQGKSDGLDLFYFGIYSTEVQDIPPWQLDNETGAREGQESDVKPTYNEMLKEEGRRRKREEEYDEEERIKKQTWFEWLLELLYYVIGWK